MSDLFNYPSLCITDTTYGIVVKEANKKLMATEGAGRPKARPIIAGRQGPVHALDENSLLVSMLGTSYYNWLCSSHTQHTLASKPLGQSHAPIVQESSTAGLYILNFHHRCSSSESV